MSHSITPPTAGTFRERRLALKFTQEQLARRARVSTSMLKFVEAGLPPSPNIAGRLERALTKAEAARGD